MGHADEQQAGGAPGVHRSRGTVAARSWESVPGRSPSCPACGATARRETALYCATCGHHLREREYSPADALRASYRWQRIAPPYARRANAPAVPLWQRRNEQTARAYVFLACALVPLVGVVFCACAVVCGVSGRRDARRAGHAGQLAEARRAVAFAVSLAGAQALLWLFVFSIPVWL